jgi:hypothetical protein
MMMHGRCCKVSHEFFNIFNSVPDPLHFLTVPDADLDPRTRFSDF